MTILTPALILVVFTSHSHGSPHIQKFNSHVSFNSPTRSFHHGVGDLQPIQPVHSQSLHGNFRHKVPNKYRSNSFRSLQDFSNDPIYPLGESHFEGYPRERPLIPFNSIGLAQYNSHPTAHMVFEDNSLSFMEPYTIPVLPPSPYKVDSPDPESLWPEGLFIPPSVPVKYGTHDKYGHHIMSNHIVDPYFIDGDNALRAITRARTHKELFYHDIPHLRALLANQELRVSNGLRPNRLGSIRESSPWFRS